MRGALVRAHPCLRDHAERPLGTAQQPVGRGTCAGAREPAGLQGTVRRDRSEPLDELVDAGRPRREVTGRARGDPAAEARLLERLREVAQRQPVRLELGLERGAESARLDAGRARDRIDLEHAVEPAEVDRDRAAVAVPHVGLDTADDARAAAVRDLRRACPRAPVD